MLAIVFYNVIDSHKNPHENSHVQMAQLDVSDSIDEHLRCILITDLCRTLSILHGFHFNGIAEIKTYPEPPVKNCE